jgi:hypothetical protein
MNNTQYTAAKISIIGPFIGPLGTDGVKICIALPDTNIETLTCTLFQGSTEYASQACTLPENDVCRCFQFPFHGLDNTALYRN